MVKLYYTPTSCGAASFIVASMCALPIQCEEVDLSTHKTASGADFYKINPKGACVRAAPRARAGDCVRWELRRHAAGHIASARQHSC